MGPPADKWAFNARSSYVGESRICWNTQSRLISPWMYQFTYLETINEGFPSKRILPRTLTFNIYVKCEKFENKSCSTFENVISHQQSNVMVSLSENFFPLLNNPIIKCVSALVLIINHHVSDHVLFHVSFLPFREILDRFWLLGTHFLFFTLKSSEIQGTAHSETHNHETYRQVQI